MAEGTTLIINIDGAARGNPGPAAYAVVVARNGEVVAREKGCLGDTTNNVAEYTALIRGLQKALALKAGDVLIRSDSELLVKQMNGEYRVKNEGLKELHEQAGVLRGQIGSVRISHVRREDNAEADRLCNEALDEAAQAGKSRKSSGSSSGHWKAIQADIQKILAETPEAYAAEQIVAAFRRRGFTPPPQ